MAETDSGDCRVRWPDDAITLLEACDNDTLRALLEKLGAKSKVGNKGELAVRVAKLVVPDGKVLLEQLYATFFKECLQKLDMTTGANAAENASRYAKALDSCFRERQSVSGKRWNLKGYSISKMGLDVLKTLCKQRRIEINKGQKSCTLVEKLEAWRKNPGALEEGDEEEELEEEEEEEGEEEEEEGEEEGRQAAAVEVVLMFVVMVGVVSCLYRMH